MWTPGVSAEELIRFQMKHMDVAWYRDLAILQLRRIYIFFFYWNTKPGEWPNTSSQRSRISCMALTQQCWCLSCDHLFCWHNDGITIAYQPPNSVFVPFRQNGMHNTLALNRLWKSFYKLNWSEYQKRRRGGFWSQPSENQFCTLADSGPDLTLWDPDGKTCFQPHQKSCVCSYFYWKADREGGLQ